MRVQWNCLELPAVPVRWILELSFRVSRLGASLYNLQLRALRFGLFVCTVQVRLDGIFVHHASLFDRFVCNVCEWLDLQELHSRDSSKHLCHSLQLIVQQRSKLHSL